MTGPGRSKEKISVNSKELHVPPPDFKNTCSEDADSSWIYPPAKLKQKFLDL